ncbi:MAG: hypothetical protein AAFY17_07870, partial [Cyanobacteria bacterium J06642_11]
VNHDEWALSNTGFANAPDAGTFTTNIANWFTGDQPGVFHAYSTNFGLTESALANALTDAGHTWTVGTDITLDLPTLLTYDGLFLAGNPVDNSVLIDYVNAGGNVYLAGGTGRGGPINEAARWNTFLNEFGFDFGAPYNLVKEVTPVNISHPIFQNVSGIYQDNGNPITDLDLSNPNNEVLLSHPTGGRIAVAVIEDAPPTPPVSVPEPMSVITLIGLATAMVGGVGLKKQTD